MAPQWLLTNSETGSIKTTARNSVLTIKKRKDMNSIGNNIEIIRFKVSPEKAAAFVAAREQADKDVSKIVGFMGSELCRLDDENWVIFIRWKNTATTKAAQQITASLQSITDWIAIAEQFVSFETAEVVHTSAYKM